MNLKKTIIYTKKCELQVKVDFNNLNIKRLDPKSDFEKKTTNFIQEWFSPSTEVQIQSSGSTGIPKIFHVSKEKMMSSAFMTCNFLKLKKGDSALLCLPIEYISGKMMIVRSIVKELALKIVQPSTQPLSELSSNVDFCAMTPLQVENSLDKIHYINNLIIGGAAVSQSLKTRIFDTLKTKSNTKVFETYGMSETLSHVALKQLYPINEHFFRVFDGVEISVDARNCLRINAPHVSEEIIQTNDVVELLNSKQFIFVGRADNIINTGGVKVSPEKIEDFIKQFMENELVVLGVSDELLGQKLTLVIEGSDEVEIREILENIPFENKVFRPKVVLFLDRLPRTPNGKINRLELQKIIKI